MPKQITFFLKLDTEENLWKNLDRKVRNQIRKAKEYDLKIREGKELLKDFYPLYQRVMKKRSSPPYGYQFFEDVIEEFRDRAKVFIAEHKSTPVAGMVTIQFGDRIASLWASSDYKFNYMNPNNFLYWEVIGWAVKNNFKYFDFGRSPYGSGTYSFKKQWGGEEKPFSHDYYLSPSGKKLVPGMTQSKWLSKIWQLVPWPLAKRLGPIIRKYIN